MDEITGKETIYKMTVTLKNSSFINLVGNEEQMRFYTNQLSDLINRIHNLKTPNLSAPFLNLRASTDKNFLYGYSWIDGREITGLYIHQPESCNSAVYEIQKRQLDIQEKFLNIMEKHSDDEDWWKKKE